MSYLFYLTPLLISFALSITFLSSLVWLNNYFSILDTRKALRHIHRSGISRLGGVAIICSFLFAILLDQHLVITTQITGIIFASIAILVVGIVDDFKQLSWKKQLFWQFAIVVFAFVMGIKLDYVTNPAGGILALNAGWIFWVGAVLSILWLIFLINSLNWIDGIDGASGGISLVGVATIFLLSLRPEVNQPPIGIITAALIGSIGAFLVFNFNPAKIIAGTSGSMFMGFILGTLAIFAGAKVATTLLVLAIPVIDALWVLLERVQSGQSIFSADHRHLHYRLLELGWSQTKICLFYYGFTFIIALVALNTNAWGKIVSFVLVVIFMTSFLQVLSKRHAKVC